MTPFEFFFTIKDLHQECRVVNRRVDLAERWVLNFQIPTFHSRWVVAMENQFAQKMISSSNWQVSNILEWNSTWKSFFGQTWVWNLTPEVFKADTLITRLLIQPTLIIVNSTRLAWNEASPVPHEAARWLPEAADLLQIICKTVSLFDAWWWYMHTLHRWTVATGCCASWGSTVWSTACLGWSTTTETTFFGWLPTPRAPQQVASFEETCETKPAS